MRTSFEEFRQKAAETNKMMCVQQVGAACEMAIANGIDKTDIPESFLDALQNMLSECQKAVQANRT